jgi:hypothetical protein
VPARLSRVRPVMRHRAQRDSKIGRVDGLSWPGPARPMTSRESEGAADRPAAAPSGWESGALRKGLPSANLSLLTLRPIWAKYKKKGAVATTAPHERGACFRTLSQTTRAGSRFLYRVPAPCRRTFPFFKQWANGHPALQLPPLFPAG